MIPSKMKSVAIKANYTLRNGTEQLRGIQWGKEMKILFILEILFINIILR